MSEPIHLRPAEYWELRARAAEVDALDAERYRFLEEWAQRKRMAMQQRNATLARVREAHGFAEADYGFDDARCALVPK